jgi:hypothetical protein
MRHLRYRSASVGIVDFFHLNALTGANVAAAAHGFHFVDCQVAHLILPHLAPRGAFPQPITTNQKSKRFRNLVATHLRFHDKNSSVADLVQLGCPHRMAVTSLAMTLVVRARSAVQKQENEAQGLVFFSA